MLRSTVNQLNRAQGSDMTRIAFESEFQFELKHQTVNVKALALATQYIKYLLLLL